MADFREIMDAERVADAQGDQAQALAANALAANAGGIGQSANAVVNALEAIRLEIRAQGMRIDSAVRGGS